MVVGAGGSKSLSWHPSWPSFHQHGFLSPKQTDGSCFAPKTINQFPPTSLALVPSVYWALSRFGSQTTIVLLWSRSFQS